MPTDEKPHKKYTHLSSENRREIREGLLAGEKQRSLAERYGVTVAAISLMNVALRADMGDPQAIERIKAKRKPRISREEWDRFSETLRSSTPEDHGIKDDDALDDAPAWSRASAIRLAEKLFGRTPSPRRFEAAFLRAFPPERNWLPENPEPPKRVTLDSLTPEQRKDKKLVAYLTSETYWQIQNKEYQDALEHYHRFLEPEHPPRQTDGRSQPSSSPPLPARKRKGPAFTKPKRRKKTCTKHRRKK